MLIKADTLGDADRRRYLEIALGQSRKVGCLAQELFELARLEYGVVQPEMESFALADLIQDVFQKFGLASETRHQQLVADIAPGLPAVTADLGLIERVLTNLLDNAIRPRAVKSWCSCVPKGQVYGLKSVTRGRAFLTNCTRGFSCGPCFHRRAGGLAGGLGLVIVKRILQLHGSDIALLKRAEKGAVFSFRLA